jgi:ankyrin repeat protein
MMARRVAGFALALLLAGVACTQAYGQKEAPAKEAPRPPTLVDAVRRGDLDQARRLVRDEGADVRAPVNAEGDTLLHRIVFLAPADRQEAGVAELVALGADVNARNVGRRTPLHFAARAGRIEAVTALLARGAEVDATDRDYATPLLDAADAGRLEVARTLLAAGAHPDLKTDPRDFTHTPLTIACLRGRLDMVELLLAGGADVNLPAARRTALDWARRSKHDRIVELLTARNAID